MIKNKKGYVWKYIIPAILLVIVLLALSSSSINTGEQAKKGVAAIALQAQINECEINSRCKIKICSEGDSCTEEEIKRSLHYLAFKKDCDNELPEDKSKSCQSELYSKISQLVKNEKAFADKQNLNSANINNNDINNAIVKRGTTLDINDYSKSPYGVTAKGETGTNSNPLETVKQIAIDTGGTHSYGNMGLNSKYGAKSFWENEKDCLGLKGIPGTSEADSSWKEIASKEPEKLVLAEIDWYNNYAINPAINSMINNNLPESFIKNPKLITYFADVVIQEGSSSVNSLIKKIKPNENETPENYLNRVANYQASDDYLSKKFKTYLSEHPNAIDGLKNRILEKRLPESQTVEIAKLEFPETCILS